MFALFTHHCTACDRRQLIFPSMATGVSSTDRGTELAFTCWCGAEQTALLADEHTATVAACLHDQRAAR